MANNSEVSTLASVIQHGIENRLKDLHTAMPGIIQEFDAAEQTASVQPAIRRVFVTEDGIDRILTPVELPLVINAPVVFPRGGGFSMTFPVSQGDECLLVFMERAMDNWHQVGDVQDPGGRRFHSISDATVFVGLSSLPNKVPNYSQSSVQLKKDDGSATFSIADNSAIRLQNSNGYVELKVDGTFDINGIIFDTHSHPQGVDSDGDGQQNVDSPVNP